MVVHLDEGFDFLGYHIQRRRQARDVEVSTSTPTPPTRPSRRSRRRCDLTRPGTTTPGGPAAPPQPCAAGLDQLLPARRVQTELPISARLRLARVVGWLRRKAPPRPTGSAPATLLPDGWCRRMTDDQFPAAPCQSLATATGGSDPDPMAERARSKLAIATGTWRAGCR